MKKLMLILLISVLGLVVFGCGQEKTKDSPSDVKSGLGDIPVKDGEAIPMELWVMSQCPYGTGAENAAKNLVQAMGTHLDVSIRYILTVNEDGSFKSLHGKGEVAMNMVQACAGYVHPSKMLDFIVAQNSQKKPWEKIAGELGLDVEKITSCLKDGTGQKILKKDAADGVKAEITSSPTFIIFGEEYKGRRASLDLLEYICRRMDKEKPAVCDNPPEVISRDDAGAGAGSCGDQKKPSIPPNLVDQTEFTHTILWDPNAFENSIDKVLEQTKQYYPKAKIEKVAYDSTEGKKLISQYGVEWLPAYIFPGSVSEAKNFSQLQQVMIKTKDGSAYKLNPAQVGSNINLGRVATPGRIKIFYSPFSPQSLVLLSDMYKMLDQPELSGAKSRLEITLIPRGDIDRQGKLTAKGNTPEVEEMARHAAILKVAPEKFPAYLEARIKDPISSYWEDFVAEVGLDTNEIKKLARSDEISGRLLSGAKEAGSVNAGPSFSILVENREMVHVPGVTELKKILKKLAK